MRSFFAKTSLWGIYCSHFCFNYGWYVLLGWLPQYFQEVLHYDLKQTSLLAALPYMSGYAGLIVFGHLSDLIIRHGVRTLHARKVMNTIGLGGPAFFLFILRYAKTPSVALVLLSAALFTGRASSSGYWVNMIDVGPMCAGKVMGISNTLATVPGIVGNVVTGYILQQSGDWNTVFATASCIMSAGALAFLLLASDQNAFQRTVITARAKKDDSDESEPFLGP